MQSTGEWLWYSDTASLLELADDRMTHPSTEEGSTKTKACFSHRRGGLIAQELFRTNTNPRRALFRSARDPADVVLPLFLHGTRFFVPVSPSLSFSFRSDSTFPAEELLSSLRGGFPGVVEGRIFSASGTSGRLDDGWCRSDFARQRLRATRGRLFRTWRMLPGCHAPPMQHDLLATAWAW